MRLFIVLLAAYASALPVSNKAVAPNGSTPPPAHAHSTPDAVQQFKGALLQSLNHGAANMRAILARAGVHLGSKQSVHAEYDRMTAWWCQQKSAVASGASLCAKRAFTAKLKGMTADQKKAAMQSYAAQSTSLVARKTMAAEAKQMIDAYCKTSQVGAGTELCRQSVSLLDMGKRKMAKLLNATALGSAVGVAQMG